MNSELELKVITPYWRLDRPYMICGSAEAESKRYNLYKGRSGRRWLVADQLNAADNIYVEGGPGSEGFGGRELSFLLVNGSTLRLRGPWHTNDDALYRDTGVDVRNRHLTIGAIGLRRVGSKELKFWDPISVADVIYQDEDWTLGEFDRIKKYAKEISKNSLKELFYAVVSQGGGSAGPVKL